MSGLGKLKPEIKAAWLTALRSGEYQQGTGFLAYTDETGADRRCCLGVLCDLAVQEGVVTFGEEDTRAMGGVWYRYEDPQRLPSTGSGSMPPAAVRDWAYDEAPNYSLEWDVFVVEQDADDPALANTTTYNLSDLNDERLYTFERIADAIEESL